MTLENVLEWLKTLNTTADSYYCGTMPNKRERSIGVYQMKASREREVAIGGAGSTKTRTKAVTLLVHWERSTRATEEAAQALYDELAALSSPVIGGHRCSYIALQNSEPVDVGADEQGIMERVIDLIIYYRKD